MKAFRVVKTEASEWIFDYQAKLFIRLSLDDDERGAGIRYTHKWEPFEEIEEIEEMGERRLCVHRPVKWGTGARRMTGFIVTDTGIPD